MCDPGDPGDVTCIHSNGSGMVQKTYSNSDEIYLVLHITYEQ